MKVVFENKSSTYVKAGGTIAGETYILPDDSSPLLKVNDISVAFGLDIKLLDENTLFVYIQTGKLVSVDKMQEMICFPGYFQKY